MTRVSGPGSLIRKVITSSCCFRRLITITNTTATTIIIITITTEAIAHSTDSEITSVWPSGDAGGFEGVVDGVADAAVGTVAGCVLDGVVGSFIGGVMDVVAGGGVAVLMSGHSVLCPVGRGVDRLPWCGGLVQDGRLTEGTYVDGMFITLQRENGRLSFHLEGPRPNSFK